MKTVRTLGLGVMLLTGVVGYEVTGEESVLICHYPQGNHGQPGQNLVVGRKAAQAHLTNHTTPPDHPGGCLACEGDQCDD